jgi:hypothetical protein
VVSVQLRDQAADPITNLLWHGHREGIDQGHRQAHATGGRGHLGAEEARTDHNHGGLG